MAINATLTIENNAGVAQTVVNQLQTMALAAIDAWSAVLAGNSTSKVTITIAETTSSERANGGNETASYIGMFNGRNVFEPGTAYELRTGLELNQTGNDIRINIARDYLLNEMFFDDTLATSNDIPGNRTDAFSVLLHEIGHALGFIGYYDEATNSYASNANTPYDTHIVLRNGEVYYDGANVRAAYGDAIALTNNNYAHYGNSGADPRTANDPLTGLMNGVFFYRGYRYSIGAIDLAVMADNGLGTIANDRFSVGLMRAFNGGAGVDTVDFLAATSGVTVSLATTASQATGGAGSVTLVGIENLIGSSFADTLTGDGGVNVLQGMGGNDTLIGGAGGDIFRDTAAGLNGDTIADFTVGDRINISDAASAGFRFSISGSTLSYTGGALTLTGGVAAGYRLAAVASSASGVDLTLVLARSAQNDFNGDGRSDIVWRNDNGAFTDWLGQPGGAFALNDAAAYTTVPLAWKVAGVGDFNGDGRADVLWRNDNGALTDWLGQSNGGFVFNDVSAYAQVSLDWKVAGVGDFNGDGRADVLWRNDNGALTDWLGQSNGGFAINNSAYTTAPTSWKVAGVGDFNGDGRDDILWRNDNGALTDWLGQANGSFALNDAAAYTMVPTGWRVAGVGDFNGDGRDDILWRNDNGALTDWLGQANGSFALNDAAAYTMVPTSWKVANVGDYNGDGRDDILWRNDNGALTDWLGQANGGFALNDAAAFTTVPTAWKVADTRALLGAAATGSAAGETADAVFAPAHAALDAPAMIDLIESRFDHAAPLLDPVW